MNFLFAITLYSGAIGLIGPHIQQQITHMHARAKWAADMHAYRWALLLLGFISHISTNNGVPSSPMENAI